MALNTEFYTPNDHVSKDEIMTFPDMLKTQKMYHSQNLPGRISATCSPGKRKVKRGGRIIGIQKAM